MRTFFVLIVLTTSFWSCEDVIEIDAPAEEPRLIVEAIIRADTTAAQVPVRFKTTQTAGFFDEITIPDNPVQGGMQLFNETQGGGATFLLPDPEQPGTFIPTGPDGTVATGGFLPGAAFTDPDDRWILTFEWRDELYLAEYRVNFSVPIDNLEQGTETLFDEDETEVKITFTDLAERDDFYVFDLGFGLFTTAEDTFFNGQQFEFSYFYDENLQPGDEITVSILGADQQFFNYMNQIIELSEGDGGPFQVPTSTARGNFLKVEGINNIDVSNNVDRNDEFILGYFAIVQEYKASLIIE